MSTPAELPRAVVPVGATPTTGPFAVPFVLGDLAELVVRKGGAAALLNVDFTATALDATGHTAITWKTAIAGVTLVLRRGTAAGRAEAYGSPIRSPALNAELDRHARRLEDHDVALAQAVSVPDGATPPVLDLSGLKGKLLTGSADGLSIVGTDPGAVPDAEVLAQQVMVTLAPLLADAVDAAGAAGAGSATAAATSATGAATSATAASGSADDAATAAGFAQASAARSNVDAAASAAAAAVSQAYAAQMGTPVDAAGNYSSQQNARYAAGSAQAASDDATLCATGATLAAGSATLAQALAVSPSPVVLPDGSAVDSAATSAANALTYATLAAALPCKAVDETTLRPDGSHFIVANVLTVRREDLFWTFLMGNTAACSFVAGLGVWTGTVLGGSASLAPLRIKRLGAGACTFAGGGGAPLDPAILLQSWVTMRSAAIPTGGDAATNRTVNVTVPAGTNRKLSVRLGACYNNNVATGRDCTLAGTGLSSVAHPVAGQGNGYFAATDCTRLDMWTASLADSPSVATSHVITLATPASWLSGVALVEAVSNCSAIANAGFVQSPSAGTAAMTLTPPEAHGLNSVTGFSQGPVANPLAFDTGTVLAGGTTGALDKKDVAYRHTTESRGDTAARTYTATEAGHLLGTPDNRPVGLLGLTYRPIAAGGGATLHAKTGLGSPPALAAGGECWLEAHSGGTDWYLAGPDLA